MTRRVQWKPEHWVAVLVAVASVIAAAVALFTRGGVFAPRGSDEVPTGGRTTVVDHSTNVAIDQSEVNANTTTTSVQEHK
jgi:hypothetical protein